MKNVVTVCGYLGLALVIIGAYLYSTDMTTTLISLIILLIGAALLATFAVFEWTMVRATLDQRATRYGTNMAAMVLILIGILTFVNMIGIRYSQRYDSTEVKRFSLASLTTNVLEGLDQDVHVVGFFRSSEAAARIELGDILDQYQYYSHRISYEFIDPDRDPSIARQYNISSYGTIVFESEGKSEHLTRANEETITNALVKVTREGQKSIYFVEGHGEYSINESDRAGLSQLQQALKNQSYIVETVLLLGETAIPNDASVIVVAGPRKDLLPYEQQAIVAYLQRGGRALFLLDPPFPDQRADLSGVLSDWHVILGNNVVVDVSGVGRMFGMSELAPAVANFPAHPITRNFRAATVFPMVRSVEAGIASTDTIEIQTIAMTSDRSWADYNPPEDPASAISFQDGIDVNGPIPVAVAVTAVPRGLPRKDMSTLTPQEAVLSPEEHEVKTRIVVVGNSTFATNTYFSLAGNSDFVMNSINWLAEEEDLIAIRPKSSDTRLVQISMSQLSSIMVFTVIIAPLCVLIIGGIVYWKRR